MPLEVFRHHHVRHLRANIGHNLAKYAERKAWAGRSSTGQPSQLSSALEPAVPLDMVMPTPGDLKDMENTILVHRAFPNLTPLQARDPRLWTKLAHVECWTYMRKRWDVSRHLADQGKAERYVLAHYFVQRAESRALLRNGMARLWWYAHLTHDAARDDPYELTAVLLEYLDIAQQVLERNMGRALAVRTGFLDFIRLNGDRLGTASGPRRHRIRELAKHLNLRGGVTLLDSLDVRQVSDMLDEELRLSQPV
jgi:hypothetical protein